MSDGLIPRRYAKALYKYAVENGDSQEIYELLKTLSFRYTAIDELKRAVLNPEISDEEKGAYMLKLVGGKPGSSLDKFLLLCVRNNRAEYLQKISLAYVDLYREAQEGMTQYEENVRMSRMVYNDTATKMNRMVRQWPSSIVASMLHFDQKDYLKVDSEEKKQYPNLDEAFKK